MTLSYRLCKSVITSAVSISKPTCRVTAIEQEGKIYVK